MDKEKEALFPKKKPGRPKGRKGHGKIEMELTKEDLRAMGLLNNTDGRPRYGLTDSSWQVEFDLRKKFIQPYPADKKRLVCNDDLSNRSYYVSFINDTLKALKSREVAYCYYIYQIEELLKFHKSKLRTRYLPESECWAVWFGNKEEEKKAEEKKKFKSLLKNNEPKPSVKKSEPSLKVSITSFGRYSIEKESKNGKKENCGD